MHPPDPPELANAIGMLRQIYWREYGRGWREANQRVREILEREAAAVHTDGEITKERADDRS